MVAAFAGIACSANMDAPERDASAEAGTAPDASTETSTRGGHHPDAARSPDADASSDTSLSETSSASEDAQDAQDAADVTEESDASGGGGPLDVDIPDSPLDVYPAPHSPMPTVLYNGGATLVTPNIIPVFYSGDPYESEVVSFLSGLVSTSFWGATTSEYGIGAATVGAPIILAGTPPAAIDDAQIQALLVANLGGAMDGGSPPWGEPSPNDIYVLYFPATTVVTPPCPCGDYHSEVPVSASVGAIYAVIQEEDNALDDVTSGTSHEIVEATTDPYVGSGYDGVDANDQAWAPNFASGQELADMCELYASSYYTPPDLPYEVQRTWSNASGAASHDPCVPVPPGEVYFNSALLPTDKIVLGDGWGVTHGVEIPLGASRTVEIDLYSDGPTSGPWTVAAATYPTPGALDFSFDTNTGVNGDKVHLTITAVMPGPNIVTLTSTLGSMTTYWYGLVGN
jgi:hypothetical protein